MWRRIFMSLFFSLALSGPAFAEHFGFDPVSQTHFYNDQYYEVVDHAAQTTNSMRSYLSWQAHRGWLKHTVVLKRTPLQPAVVAPVKKPEPEVKVAPKIEIPPEVKALPTLDKKVTQPLRVFKDDVAPPLLEIDPEATLLIPKVVGTKPAPPLTKTTPPALLKINWVAEGKQLSAEEKEKLAAGTRTLSRSATSWQNDFLDRFSDCNSGFCQAKEKGTFEKLPMPFQVPMGQVRLLKLETEYLETLLKQEGKPNSATMAQVLRVVRRAEALRPLLEATAVVKDRPYVQGMEDSLAALQEVSKSWNYFTTSESKGWVLRWQLLALDVQVWTENLDYLARIATGDSKERLEKVTKDFKEAAQKMGDSPWELPMNEQRQIAQKIYDSASVLFKDYADWSKKTDEGSREPDSYLGTIAFLGANENVRYLTYNIILSIEGQ